jgi:hypothetical protein
MEVCHISILKSKLSCASEVTSEGRVLDWIIYARSLPGVAIAAYRKVVNY